MGTSDVGRFGFLGEQLRLKGLPVFVYHGLTASADELPRGREKKYWVHKENFLDHLKEIVSMGYRVTLLRDSWNPRSVPSDGQRRAVLTFDDGWASQYDMAFPRLLEAGFRADFFVNTGTIGTEGFFSWSQVAEMHRAGMAFHSHGHDHVLLTVMPLGELRDQLQRSKWLLEDRLGCSVDFLAVPYSSLSRRVLRVAREAGYRAVCGYWNWPARPGAEIVNRLAAYKHTTGPAFRRLLTGNPLSYLARAARTALLAVPKRAVLSLQPHWLGEVLGEQVQ